MLQRSASLTPERLLNNGTSTHTDEEGGSSQRLRTEKPLSMIVPRRAISDSRFARCGCGIGCGWVWNGCGVGVGRMRLQVEWSCWCIYIARRLAFEVCL